MHPGAYEFVGRYASADQIRVIEIGSRNINGTARDHFPAAAWTGLDPIAGPCVDIVCNALDYYPDTLCELVVCCEVFEHTPDWRYLIERAYKWLLPSGRLIVTCAGIGREQHSGIDGGALHFAEWYYNISPSQLLIAIEATGFHHVDVSENEHWKDTYATAIK